MGAKTVRSHRGLCVSIASLALPTLCALCVSVVKMFSKILIANRGEIACRVIRTARRMGVATVAVYSDAAAKALMEAHGVPVVPGYHGEAQDAASLAAEAERIGYPVLIKASAGGGGRGMRIVTRADEFARALIGAKREAAGAFGDDRVLIERYLERPRHIEVQVFGDTHGNIVHLWERDCSIQRRHQKVVEEAPAPGIDEARRKKLGETAVAAARAVGYVGAGTVEFIADGGSGKNFYFMEMNTRLQVEHPVTEVVTGTDLVEWQIRVAAGEALPLQQSEIALHGHAIEVRLYAENPERGFLPATGTLHRLHFPDPDLARVDTGVRPGDTVTPFYDPMIAKIIAWGEDRDAARARLQRALADTAILGVTTNLAFLHRIIAAPDFAAGQVDTGFIERHRDTLLPSSRPAPDIALAAAALWRLMQSSAASDADRFSPWARTNGWRLNDAAAPVSLHFRYGAEEITVEATAAEGGWKLRLGERDCTAAAEPSPDGRLALTLDGVRCPLRVLEYDGELAVFQLDDAAGETVRQGQPMMVIEAMKM